MLCSMSVAALAAEPMTEADTVSTMISAADTLPGISAYPAEVRASEENGVYRLEKVYYLTAKDDPTTIPTADFEREGRTYTLLDLLKNDQTETDTREHIEVVTLESKTKDMTEILKMLEPKLEVKTEDGYEGVLSLDHTTIQVEAAGYGTSNRTVTAERTYPNLSDADVSLVPKSVNENGRTLTLADVSWQEAAVDPTDGYDIPIRYTAVASYTGTATSKYATGYTVTADYKGDVTRTSCDTVVYTAVFSSVGNAAVKTGHSSFNWLWLLIPVGAAALGGCGYAGYIDALLESYIFYEVKRFDIKGKDYLRTLGKYYIVDPGLRTYLLGNRGGDVGHILENIVYFELLRRGYEVAIGKVGEKEIDFIATKMNEKKYIQVTDNMNAPETRARELAPLQAVQDNYEKIVIAMDCDLISDVDGIKIVKALDFLLSEV